jgi:hypothetical protein
MPRHQQCKLKDKEIRMDYQARSKYVVKQHDKYTVLHPRQNSHHIAPKMVAKQLKTSSICSEQ